MRQDFKSNDEIGRQCALDRLAVLDTKPEPGFEKITALVQTVFDVPIAAVSLIDRDRQWFKSIRGLDVAQTPRAVAFCDHTIRTTDCLVVPDATQDPRFAENALVTGPPFIRSYVGAPIITPDGYALGSLCAIDYQPRDFPPDKILVLSSFADLVMNELELRQLASCDGLTGLANRLSFERAADEALHTPGGATLLFLDLDRFKNINDTYGHAVGDDVIKVAADILAEQCLPGACAARIGGEEFALLLPGHDVSQAAAIAERIRHDIEQAQLPEHPDLPFTASIGLASATESQSVKEWALAADSALYAAKTSGRNRVVQHEALMKA